MINIEKLSKKVVFDYDGVNFVGYKFDISNSPMIRVSKGKKKEINSCSCAHHSIRDIHMKTDCIFIKALRLWLKLKEN